MRPPKAKAKAESTDAVKRGVGLAPCRVRRRSGRPRLLRSLGRTEPRRLRDHRQLLGRYGQGADSGAQCTAHEALRPIGLPVEKIAWS